MESAVSSLKLEDQNGSLTEELTAKIEPFDSFWEGPEDVEKGYETFFQFYRYNYLKYLPKNKSANILVVSCGPGYFMNMLEKHGYQNVLGIDSFPDKIEYAKRKKLNCQVERAFPFLKKHKRQYNAIFCEQELNHLTKEEIMGFLNLCQESLVPGGTLIVHALNGANPITGAEALAQNFDHYNTFTEYTMRQVLTHCQFRDIRIIPLNLYVFFTNPLNYVLKVLDKAYSLFFTFSFMLYGKANRVWTKKIGAVCCS
ncbi:MAG: class I SAM-dependent methyltransferase [Nitrospirae bacterium]|nr:class I SAM-dependent methyltransferase [Nitrospirota bacterium]